MRGDKARSVLLVPDWGKRRRRRKRWARSLAPSTALQPGAGHAVVALRSGQREGSLVWEEGGAGEMKATSGGGETVGKAWVREEV